MSNLFDGLNTKVKAVRESLVKVFRRRRSPVASITATARAALSSLSSLYTGYAGGDDEAIATVRSTDVPFGFDLETMMENGDIEAMVVMIIGKINSRKTTLAKNILFVRLRTAFGGRQSRAIVEDVIVRNGEPEWRRTAELLKCEPIPMHEAFNPIAHSYGMSIDEHMITIEDLITSGGLKPLVGINDYAARVAFTKMYKEYPNKASIPTFSRTLERLKVRDVLKYKDEVDKQYTAKMLVDAQETGEEIPPELLELMERDSNVRPERVVEAALEVFFDLDKVPEGPLGRMFSGTKSIDKRFAQRLVVLDYTQLLGNPAAIALVKRFIRRLLESAKNRNDLRFMFQTDISDEAYKMLRIGDEAINQSDDVKGIRTANKAKIMLTQRIPDLMSVGDSNSQSRNASNNILGDVSIFIIGRQGKKDVKALCEVIDLTEPEQAIIQTQDKGQFLVKIVDKPGIPIDTNTMFTKTLAYISQSNGALDAALDRKGPVVEDAFIEKT